MKNRLTILAQNGYNCIQRESRVFEENCPSNLQKNMQIEGEERNETSLKLTLYPNPTNGMLFIQSNFVDVHEANCIIQSIEGRKIFDGAIHFSEGLDLGKLSIVNGWYIIEINTPQGKYVEQFIYQK